MTVSIGDGHFLLNAKELLPGNQQKMLADNKEFHPF
jgi:hypothetical protein